MQLLLANEVKEIKEIEKHFALLSDSQPISHDPIEGTSHRVNTVTTNTLYKPNSVRRV